MNNRQSAKEKLLSFLEEIKNPDQIRTGAPVTDLQVGEKIAQQVEEYTQKLEALNPNLYPLLYALPLLDGVWQLSYSSSREIRNLGKLPYGLKVGKVYQVINLAEQSFFNQAFVEHSLGFVSGYVLVTATFSVARDNSSPLPDKRLNINFEKRYLAIQQIAGIKTPKLDPFKVVPARNPIGRVPTFDITYLDEDLRIGRGGDGGLYILFKAGDRQ